MAKKYFIWADPNCNGENIEWVEINKSQFDVYKVGRHFIRVDGDRTSGYDEIVMEATYPEKCRWNSMIRKQKYLEVRDKFKISRSIDEWIDEEDSIQLIDTFADETFAFENRVFDAFEIERLMKYISQLSEKEKEIIDILLIASQTGKFQKDIFPEFGINKRTFIRRKKKLAEKIQNFLK